MNMNRNAWIKKLDEMGPRLGFKSGYKFLYVPWKMLEDAESGTAFLSLNPGTEPDGAEQRTISDERGNSYEVEEHTTKSPITAQFLALAKLIDRKPCEILTGVVAPFRSRDWGGLTDVQESESLRLGKEFWQQPLQQKSLRLIIACGRDAEKIVVEMTKATFKHKVPAEWGNVKLHRYLTGDGKTIIGLPHLSRYRLLSNSTSKSALITILGGFVGSQVP